jgi:hypothetical protein
MNINICGRVFLRCIFSLICLLLSSIAFISPAGFHDNSSIPVACFGVVSSIAIFFPRLGVFRIHVFWILFSVVIAQQMLRRERYQKFRADSNQQAAQELAQELELMKKRQP